MNLSKNLLNGFMSKKLKWEKFNFIKIWLFILFPSVLIVLFLISFNLLFINRVYPNVYFAKQSYSGIKRDKVLELVKNQTENINNSKISFSLGDRTFENSIVELGISMDDKAISKIIINYCRDENIISNFKCKIGLIFTKPELKPVYKIDFAKLSNNFDRELTDIDKKAVSAKIEYSQGQFKIIPSKPGFVVDRNKAVSDLILGLDNFDNEPIELSLIQELPNVKESQMSGIVENLKSIEGKNISLVFGYDKWNLLASDLVNLLDLESFKETNGNRLDFSFLDNNYFISDVNSDFVKNNSINVTFDETKISTYVDKIAKSIDRPTKDATFRFENGKIVAFAAAIDGQILDRDELRKLILDSIVSDAGESKADFAINIPVKITRAKITNSEINSLGIIERIGNGVSYFAGSIPNRVFNIGLGSKLISGTLVGPGEIFSFNSLVGPVSAEQGFKQAFVINKGKTVLDDGGGICQVSTTVFRAALNAGLPIVQRTAHAYRVGYYEQQGFKPGLDATIFSPSVDFQFKNDTANHILVQAVVDIAHSKLQVDIFGTGDGRRVEMGNVTVSNIIPAPEPLYQDDLTLPKGTTKQVEYSANGATALFSRKVYKGGQLVIDENFKSVFRPWQAVYLVGKG